MAQGNRGTVVTLGDEDPRLDGMREALGERLVDVGGSGEQRPVRGAPAEARFDRLTRLTAQVFGTQAASVTLVGTEWVVAASVVGMPTKRVPRQWSFCRHAVEEDDTFVVSDARLDPRFRDNPLVTRPNGVRFYAGHPLHSPDGEAIGTLCVFDSEPRQFSAEQVAILRSLAEFVEREINYRDERDRAEALQRSLLPATAPQFSGYQAAGICLPSYRVGGDFYDWYVNGYRDRLIASVADVMGKGTPAAILAATVRAVLRAETLRAGMPGAVERTAEDLDADLEAIGAFATLFHASFGPGGDVLYSDAGHGLAVAIPADPTRPPRPLAAGGPPIGLLEADSAGWAARRITLAPGETLVIYSDGLLDLAPDAAATITLAAELARGDLPTLPDRVRAAAQHRSARTDDITVLAIRYTGS